MTLEELLNKLIEKGWKPFGEDKIDKVKYIEHEGRLKYVFFSETSSLCRTYSIREISSMSSGLWQFVCKNGMIETGCKEWLNEEVENGKTISSIDEISMESYYYRVIESALCDEDKLEQFLLDNIKIDE